MLTLFPLYKYPIISELVFDLALTLKQLEIFITSPVFDIFSESIDLCKSSA